MDFGASEDGHAQGAGCILLCLCVVLPPVGIPLFIIFMTILKMRERKARRQPIDTSARQRRWRDEGREYTDWDT